MRASNRGTHSPTEIEARQLFERVIRDYGEFEINGSTLSEEARRNLDR